MSHTRSSFVSLGCAVLTVSDTRTPETDRSGGYLVAALKDAGHRLIDYQIVIDDQRTIADMVQTWIASARVHAVLVTGGTGLRRRDVTLEALEPLFTRSIPGFGEYFRAVSAAEIGSSTIQSRAAAGLCDATLVVCLPGSTGACRTAWENILLEQLDATHAPCNFVEVLDVESDD